MADEPLGKRRRKEDLNEESAGDGDAEEEGSDEEGEEEDAEDEEEEEGSGSELSMQVDDDGRVCNVDGPLTRSMSFEPPVRVLDGFVPAESVGALRECCERCFRVRPSKGRYSSGTTFWADWGQAPRCELEALALAILQRHCPEPAAPAGVEWWTLCLDGASDVGWHWDRDYVLEDSGVNIHPMLATVTYLSAATSQTTLSTVTLDVVSPPTRDAAKPVALADSGAMLRCTLVPPHPGRHLVFDGRFLHGAPRRVAAATGPRTGPDVRRVTFLANIWVGHKPGNASPLPANLHSWASGAKEDRSDVVFVAKAPAAVPPVEVARTDLQDESFPLEGGTLKVQLPTRPSDDTGQGAVRAALVEAKWARS
mmetsp:Transcript_13470/g.36295  ORF Transcript_13470/g.36295 Transcript_13470/m.36295 type:complete len:367 (-) Transcript_13470:279-1379(-)